MQSIGNVDAQTQASETLWKVLSDISQTESISLRTVREYADPKIDDEKLPILADMIEGLRSSIPTVKSVRRLNDDDLAEAAKGSPAGTSECVWKIDMESRWQIGATLWVATSQDGLLTGFRFDIPSPTKIKSVDDLIMHLRLLDDSPSVHLSCRTRSINRGPTRDVASIYKVLILLAVQESLDRGLLSLTDQYYVDNLTPLSGGLTGVHRGNSLSLQDLCNLMILRSDNTATDLVVSAVGTDAIDRAFERAAMRVGRCCIPENRVSDWQMSTYIERAWQLESRPRNDPQPQLKRLEPVHGRGIGFFIPLDIIAASMEMAARAPWHPWPVLPVSGDVVFYKGGSAPGVHSGIWFDPQGDRTVVISANSGQGPYGTIEEAYLIRCGEVTLRCMNNWFSHGD